MSEDTNSVYQQFGAIRFVLTIGLIALFIVMAGGFFILVAGEFGTLTAYLTVGGLLWALIIGFLWMRSRG